MTIYYVYDKLDDLDKRLKEIDLLLSEADKNQSNLDMYNTLCRSSLVLLVAHFEGSLKGFAKAYLDDFNDKKRFIDAQYPLKLSFCEYFMEPNEGGNYSKQLKDKMISHFDKVDIKFVDEPFISNGSNKRVNKNPSPHQIEIITNKFGLNNFFAQVEGSQLNVVFQENKPDMIALRDRLRAELNTSLNKYPYDVDLSKFGIYDKARISTSLWEGFISELLKNRHEVAHGKIITNATTHKSLEISRLKIEILLYGYIAILSKYICK